MKNWDKIRLGDLCELITKGTTPTSVGFKFTDSGVKFIKVESLTESGEIIPNKVAYIDEDCHKALKRSQLKENDILFSIAGALGRIGIVKREILPANTNQALAIIRLKKDSNTIVDFIAKYFNSSIVTDEIEKLRIGAAQQNLSLTQLNNLNVPFPTLPEQQRIVSILDKAFAAIDKAKANAEQNLKNAKELFESYLQGVFENKVHGNKYNSLNELCELIVDCEHKTAPTQETGYPSIRTPNIGKGELILEDVNRVSLDTYIKWTKRAIPKAGDLILAREAPAGNIAVIPDNVEVCLGQRTVLIRLKKDKLIPKYLAYLILSKDVQRILLSHSTGATVQHINMKDIRAFKIYDLSDINEQQTIVCQLDALRAETQKLEAVYQKKIADLEELKKSILQKAFRGELESNPNPDTTYLNQKDQLNIAAEPPTKYQNQK